jgi:hypothetical protein
MSITKPKSIKELVDNMAEGRSYRATTLRKLIDRTPEIKQYFALDEQYKERYNEFLKAYEEHAQSIPEEERASSRKKFSFDGMQFQTSTGEKAAKGNLNFRQIKSVNKKLFPELKEGYEFGHQNVSVLRGMISLFLNEIDKKDPRRKPALALLQLLAQIDKIDKIMGTVGENKDQLIQKLGDIAASGADLTSTWQKDVNILKGVEGKLVIEAEWDELNQFKGKLSALAGQAFAGVVRNETEHFARLIGNTDISGLKGSPNLVEDITEDVLQVLDPQRKRTKKKTKATAKKVSTKTKSKSRSKKLRTPNKRRRNSKGVASSPLQLIGVLNKKLPDTVRRNMREPGLQNRTGQFAESVKVTNIMQTPQGFPSIGYTYQRDPYEVFEMGSSGNWATPERDPRTLIDRSIREVAAEFALGRFYTRRE